MQSFNWAPEHCRALREFVGLGMSYVAAAKAINEKFGTSYTRNAAIGRGRRMGLGGSDGEEKGPKRLSKAKLPNLQKRRERQAPQSTPQTPPVKRTESVKLRCVGVKPRLLALVELEEGDCRYPYGGDKDGEAITFCGHPRLPGCSYCAPHFRLTREDSTASQRVTGPVVLRLVAAA
jgi:GcrA cell cycle regulator